MNLDLAERHVNIREFQELFKILRIRANEMLLGCRLINGSDSAVSIGAIAKGRSPSSTLNRVLREYLGYWYFGRKTLSNVHIPTDPNVADDPTRSAPIREPGDCSDYFKTLITPDLDPSGRFAPRKPSHQAFVELYAGSARLTASCPRRCIWVEPPFEAYPKGRYTALCDLDLEVVQMKLIWNVIHRYYWWVHIGLPCTAWASANTLNGGTRSAHYPDGHPHNRLPRKHAANLQAAFICKLCKLLHKHGCYFTIENHIPIIYFNAVGSLTLIHLCHFLRLTWINALIPYASQELRRIHVVGNAQR